MPEEYQDPWRGPYVRKQTSGTMWALGILAVLLSVGMSYWAANLNGAVTNAASRPAVPASPTAVVGPPTLPLQETTGEAPPAAR